MRSSSDQTNEWLQEKTQSLRNGGPPRIEVFLRTLAPPIGVREQQESVLERLQSFERRGLVDIVSVNVWGSAICPDGHCAETAIGRRLLDRVAELREWGADLDRSVETPIEERSVSSTITDEQFRKIVFPRLCLGVYADDGLELVLPCSIEDRSLAVEDFLQSFDRPATTERGIGTSA